MDENTGSKNRGSREERKESPGDPTLVEEHDGPGQFWAVSLRGTLALWRYAWPCVAVLAERRPAFGTFWRYASGR